MISLSVVNNADQIPILQNNEIVHDIYETQYNSVSKLRII